MDNYPRVVLTSEMIEHAKMLVPQVQVNRTVASRIDTLAGNLGEFAFAQYFYGDWRMNRVGDNKGDVNFIDIEIKTSAFPFRDTLNLLVREDYAKKRKPPFYIQIIISVDDKKASEIHPNTIAYICGYASAYDVDRAPKRDMGSKFGGSGGYRCHFIQISKLNPMQSFARAYGEYQKEKNNGK